MKQSGADGVKGIMGYYIWENCIIGEKQSGEAGQQNRQNNGKKLERNIIQYNAQCVVLLCFFRSGLYSVFTCVRSLCHSHCRGAVNENEALIQLMSAGHLEHVLILGLSACFVGRLCE